MRKYVMLALNGIKKKKGDTVALLILIGFATIMMYIGISVFSNVVNVLDQVNERNHGADVMISTPLDDKDMEGNILSLSEVKEVETSESLYAYSGKYWREGDKKEEMSFMVERMDKRYAFFIPEIINKGDVAKDNSIILPYFLHVGKGYETGDLVKIQVNQTTYECEVYGFMEDVLFAQPTNISIFHVQVAPKMYEKMGEQMSVFHTFRVRTTPDANTEDVEGKISEVLEKKSPEYKQYYNLQVNYGTMRFGDTLTANIIMAILVAFAVIILVVAIVIVCFSIQNSIEQNMTNTGIMEAAGFTTGQLMFATVMESILVALVGIAAALMISPFLSEAIGGIIASSIGVRWQLGFDGRSALITGTVIFVFIVLATYLEARGYKKISILDALRGGVKTHNFRINHLPLEKTFLPLNVALGVKGILNQKKKSVAICLIIMVLAVACSSGFFLQQNFVESQDNMLQLVGLERTSAQIQLPDDMDIHKVGEKIGKIQGVKDVNYFTSNTMKLAKGSAEESYTVDYWEDTDKIQTRTIVEGRYPLYDNEIAISRLVCEKLDARVGDVIRVTSGDTTDEYLVVGMTQHIEYLGKKAVMTFDGVRRVNSSVKPNVLMLYTREDMKFGTLEKEIHKLYPELEVINSKQIIQSTCDPISQSMAMLCLVFNICTVLIIMIILFLMIRMKLTQEKVRMGVKKAMGFTTGQLMLGVIMNYVPTALVGSVFGVIVSYFTFDSLTSMCLAFCGVRGCDMEKGFSYMALTVLLITVTSLVASVLMSVRIRRVEPCRMIRES